MNDNLQRLPRRCAAWNETKGSNLTPEEHDYRRNTEYLKLAQWDAGWEACETRLRSVAAQFRKEADDLAGFEQPRVQGAVVAYRDMADKLDAMFPPDPASR